MKKLRLSRGPQRGPLRWWLLLIVVVFAVLAVGPPLWGDGVFAGTDLLVGAPHTAFLEDTINAALPQADLFAAAARHGNWLNWNPYIAGGVPLGATPNAGLASPLMLPYLFLPAWAAPAYVKLLEIACAVGGCYLYLRRIKLGASAALLGGLVFASSAFMIVWTNYPQTRTAAFIPALFWAIERLVQRRRPWDAALIALALAAMLLGGFPSVTGYALYTAAGYLLVRAFAEYRHERRRLFGVTAGALGGILGGFALAAVQLVPFAAFMGSAYVGDRVQGPHSTLLPTELLTTVAPWALGTSNPDRPPLFFVRDNLVEGMAYVGAAALVLAVFAMTRPGRARRLTPVGVLPAIVVATLLWLELIFVGGWPLGALEHLPVFTNNFIGRARSVLGFLVAVLVAIGFQLVIQRLPVQRAATATRYRWWRPAGAGTVRLAILGGLVAAVVLAWQLARRTAPSTSIGQRLSNLDRQVADRGGSRRRGHRTDRSRPAWGYPAAGGRARTAPGSGTGAGTRGHHTVLSPLRPADLLPPAERGAVPRREPGRRADRQCRRADGGQRVGVPGTGTRRALVPQRQADRAARRRTGRRDAGLQYRDRVQAAAGSGQLAHPRPARRQVLRHAADRLAVRGVPGLRAVHRNRAVGTGPAGTGRGAGDRAGTRARRQRGRHPRRGRAVDGGTA